MSKVVAGVLVACVSLIGCATAPPAGPVNPPPSSPNGRSSQQWPPLPTNVITGRAATQDDVAAGRALFAAQAEGAAPAEAIAVPLPQYAYCSPNGAPIPGVVLQAERAAGMEVAGFRDLAGKGYVTLLAECRLLGQRPPTE